MSLRYIDSYTPNTYDNPHINEWEEEIVIIKRRRKKRQPEDPNPVQPWEVEPDKPWDIKSPWKYDGPPFTIIWGDQTEPCMFDNLPPSSYMISCPCPRHCVIC